MIYWRVAKLESLCQIYSLPYFLIPEWKSEIEKEDIEGCNIICEFGKC